MEHGGTRADFRALGRFRGDPERLYAATRALDFDIESWDWLAAAAPEPDTDLSDQLEGWVRAWISCSRWAGTVGRRPAYLYHLERAGIGPLVDAVREKVVELAEAWDWPAVDRLEATSTDHLEVSYALLEAGNHAAWNAPSFRIGMLDDAAEYRAWYLALRLELQLRGQLPRSYTEVSEYDGAARILVNPTQLYADDFGRTIPESRKRRIVDEWCDFFASGPTPIRYLAFTSRAPKRLISALHGQTQLRGLSIKWGDYDDISALATMPDLWIAELNGASGLADLEPLRSAGSLRILRLEDTRRVADYSPVGDLVGLEELELRTGLTSSALPIPSIDFLRKMSSLRHLVLAGRVLDEDYAPLLVRADLESLWLRKQKSMHPSYEELALAIPGLRLE